MSSYKLLLYSGKEIFVPCNTIQLIDKYLHFYNTNTGYTYSILASEVKETITISRENETKDNTSNNMLLFD